MNPEDQENAIKILIEVAKALLDEIEAGGDLGYHLDTDEYGGRLREALTLLGHSYPKPRQDKHEIG